MIVAGTGHRPEDCVSEAHVRQVISVIFRYKPVDVFISGMAAGFDLWAADEALAQGIDVVAARPWAGHKPRNADKKLYDKVMRNAGFVVNVHEEDYYKGPFVYLDRNHWMVENCDALVAYYNVEKTQGGTAECYNYADGKVPINNVYYDPPF